MIRQEINPNAVTGPPIAADLKNRRATQSAVGEQSCFAECRFAMLRNDFGLYA